MPRFNWNFRSVAAEAKKHKKRSEFIRQAAGAYQWAFKNKHLDEVCAHMLRHGNIKWDLITVAAVAKKFSTRGEFYKQAGGAYKWARQNNHLDEVCAHMKPAAPWSKWDLATVAAVAKKFSTRGEFHKQANGAYLWAFKNKHLDEVCAHMRPSARGRKPKWDLETVAAVAMKYGTRTVFKRKASGAYDWAFKNKHLDEVCAHMKPVKNRKTWNFTSVAAEAKKYNTRTEFNKQARGAYQWAFRNKHLNEVCAHMNPAARKSTWDLETVATVAKKFSTRRGFRQNSPDAFFWAWSHGALSSICSHMTPI